MSTPPVEELIAEAAQDSRYKDKCKFTRAMEAIDKKDARAILEAYNNDTISASGMARVLLGLGRPIAGSTVRRHLLGCPTCDHE